MRESYFKHGLQDKWFGAKKIWNPMLEKSDIYTHIWIVPITQGGNVLFLEIWVRLAKFNNLLIETEGKKKYIKKAYINVGPTLDTLMN